MGAAEPRVYFIGAGPGDPELLTLKGRRLIEAADLIVYADSLVSQEVLSFAKKGAEIRGSSSMTLEEITSLIAGAVAGGSLVARVHTGDPSLYGAISEQMAALDQLGISYRIIPGVSSMSAAAASLGVELTVPEVSQTVIITRVAGRTPVPELEGLAGLAAHQSTVVLFLSAGLIEAAVTELVKGGRPLDTPVSIVYRASREDEKIIRTTLSNLAADARRAGIVSQAIVVIGKVLASEIKDRGRYRSRLYHRDFRHRCRDTLPKEPLAETYGGD